MRRLGHFVVLLWVGLSAASAAVARPSQQSAGGPPPTPTTVLMPPKIVAGHPATLAVLDASGRLLPGAKVNLTGVGEVVTDATGRATFVAPDRRGVLLASLPGEVLTASSVNLEEPEPLPAAIHVDQVPPVVSLTEHFEIVGSGFRGEAQVNQVWLGEEPAIVLASSPIALVVLPNSRTKPGPAAMRIAVGQQNIAPLPITLAALDVTSQMPHVTRAEHGTLTARVLGTPLRQIIEVRNLTRDVVALPRGDVQRVVTRGNDNNIAVIDLIGLKEGDFQISVKLIPNAEDLPDIEAARLYLIAARELSPDGFIDRVDRLIRRLERDPGRPERVERELEEMVKEKGEGELGKRLEAALRTLQKAPI